MATKRPAVIDHQDGYKDQPSTSESDILINDYDEELAFPLVVTKEETVISIDPEEKNMHLQMEVLDHDYICMGNKSDSDKFMKDFGVQTDISMEDMNKATEELNQLAGLKTD